MTRVPGQTSDTATDDKSVSVAYLLSQEAVEAWPAQLLTAGRQVLAPVLDGDNVEYRLLNETAPNPTGLGHGLPRISPKSAWFPRTEPILHIQKDGRRWAVNDPSMEFPHIVVFGARPCDATAPDILAPLFGWDHHDPFFEERIKRISFVVLACDGPVDAACFCTSVGIDPAGEACGDVLLTRSEDGMFRAEPRTAAGRELLKTIVDFKPAQPDSSLANLRDKVRQSIPTLFDATRVRAALEKRFNDPLWARSSQPCLGCGTCAFVCPTCHCFDIQEEMGGREGLRQKNWDACAFGLFTLHASGHNPRPDQASRWRQRLSHKFRYYPEKFGHTLCTGCGRCLRLCPAGMDMLADLQDLSSSGEVEVRLLATDAPQPIETPQPAITYPQPATNIYRPYLMRVVDLRDETPDVRTLRLEFSDPADGAAFEFRVGQFGLYSAWGEGESTFCIASSSTRKGYIECTFRQAGRVTRALRRLNVGDSMGFRGPYGNSFPVESWRGKDLLFIAGGIALPPMRSVIQYCLDRRDEFGKITIIYGARTWSDHVYKDELAEWEARPDVDLWLCVDWRPISTGVLVQEPAEEGWLPLDMKDPAASKLDATHRRYTGFVPQLVEAVKPSPENRIAVLCGPPIMIKFTLASLKKLGYQSENVFTTLENRMKCGVGKCGRCNVGPIYVCKEGPVFTAAQVEQLPPEM